MKRNPSDENDSDQGKETSLNGTQRPQDEFQAEGVVTPPTPKPKNPAETATGVNTGFPTWKQTRENLFTPEERAESDRRVAEIGKQLEGEWTTWEDVERELFTPEEIEASDRRVARLLARKQVGIETEQSDKSVEPKAVQYFRICRIRCKRCGDVLEYRNKSKQDNSARMIWCGCGRVALDPSAVFYRTLGEPRDYEDLSEPWQD